VHLPPAEAAHEDDREGADGAPARTVTSPERKALLFLAVVGALGAGARVAADRGSPQGSPRTREALAAQLSAVDSARAARHEAKRAPKRAPKRRRERPPARPSPGALTRAPRPSPAAPAAPIDVDVADSAALDRLPGIGPALAARIVADRAARGAFGSVAGLERVRGIGPALGKRVAPHVTFSGIPRPTSAAEGSVAHEAAAPSGRRRSPDG
jgi:DNA uptake protein ComE-like DNA-binding protein